MIILEFFFSISVKKKIIILGCIKGIRTRKIDQNIQVEEQEIDILLLIL